MSPPRKAAILAKENTLNFDYQFAEQKEID